MKLKKQKMGGQPKLARMSKILALARGTAEMAKGMVLFHQIESELESEIEEDKKRAKPTTKCGKLRRRGEHLLHGKYLLLTVVILNVLDCLLVLGELMLDIKYVTDLLTSEYKRSEDFIFEMKTLYPVRLGYLGTRDIESLEYEILIASLTWNNSNSETGQVNGSVDSSTLSEVQSTPTLQTTFSTASPGNNVRKRRASTEKGNTTYPSASRYTNDPTRSTEVKIVTGLHKTSITILIILVCETIFKIFCFGKRMLKYKLECFDGFIVIASFIIDVVFIKGLQQFTVQEYILILAFIVPWRIIRVVNSLVVAISCHEHFRLVIVYKQTKKLSANMREVKDDNKRLEGCIEVLVKMCVDAGLPDKLVKAKLVMCRNEGQNDRATAKAIQDFSNYKIEDDNGGENVHGNINSSFDNDIDSTHSKQGKLNMEGSERFDKEFQDDNDTEDNENDIDVNNIVTRL